MNNIKLNDAFRSDTPVLPAVKIVDEWAYYDGPLFGICEINGQQLFFMDAIYDTWRHYTDGEHQRLWAIYGVFDISIDEAKKILDKLVYRDQWQSAIENESECIGIFWEYERTDCD